MKVKTSVFLSPELLDEMRPYLTRYHDRSEFVECALRTFLAGLIRKDQYDRELELLNRYADELNEEALDALDYQVPL